VKTVKAQPEILEELVARRHFVLLLVVSSHAHFLFDPFELKIHKLDPCVKNS